MCHPQSHGHIHTDLNTYAYISTHIHAYAYICIDLQAYAYIANMGRRDDKFVIPSRMDICIQRTIHMHIYAHISMHMHRFV